MSLTLTILRWSARLAGLLVAAGFVTLAVGEMMSPHSASPSHLSEWTGIILLSLTCVGMILAWKWELPGAVLSLGALAAFLCVIRMNRYGVMVAFAAPGALFLVDWTLRRYALASRP